MFLRVRKIGEDLVLRIPSEVAAQLQLEDGSRIGIRVPRPEEITPEAKAQMDAFEQTLAKHEGTYKKNHPFD